MFGKILISPLKPVTTCGVSSIPDVWQGLEFAFAAINYFRKSVGYLFTLNLINIFHHISRIKYCARLNICVLRTYLLNNKNYYTCFLAICFYRLRFEETIFCSVQPRTFNITSLVLVLTSSNKHFFVCYYDKFGNPPHRFVWIVIAYSFFQ